MGKYIEKQIGKFKMRIMSKSGGINETLRKMKPGKEREPELLYVVRDELKQGMYVFDCGANIGYLSLIMADIIGEDGKLVCIEPDPDNFDLLCQNLEINNFKNNSICYKAALNDVNGYVDFYSGNNATNLGSLSKHNKSVNTPIKVESMTFSELYNKFNILPEFMKMDIEGGEQNVLRGSYNFIKDNKFPLKIIMELHPQFYSNDKNGLEYWLRKYLNDCNFNAKLLISAAVPHPDKFKEWGYKEPKLVINKKGFYYNMDIEHFIIASCRINKQWIPGKNKYSQKIARYILIERL